MDNLEKEQLKEEKKQKRKAIFQSKKEKYMNNLNVEKKANIKDRTIVALIMLAVVLPAIFLGNYVFFALILFIAFICSHEIAKTPQSLDRRFSPVIYVFSILTMFILAFYMIFKNNILNLIDLSNTGRIGEFYFDLTLGFDRISISLPTLAVCIVCLFIGVLVDKNFSIHDAFYFIGMFLIVSLAMQSLLFLRYAPFTFSYLILPEGSEAYTMQNAPALFKYLQSVGLVGYVLIGVCMNDVGAYFSGLLFGKHQFAPRISPKKTWEGTIGGLIISVILSVGYALIMDAVGLPILGGVLDLHHWYNLLILSLLIPVFGTFGDLMFSSIKRAYGIKDFGTILRSHGGFLDRIDSMVTTSIMVSLIIPIMVYGAKFFQM